MLRPGRMAGLLATSERSDGTPLDGHGLPDLAVGRAAAAKSRTTLV
jgi:hypothetical protein